MMGERGLGPIIMVLLVIQCGSKGKGLSRLKTNVLFSSIALKLHISIIDGSLYSSAVKRSRLSERTVMAVPRSVAVLIVRQTVKRSHLGGRTVMVVRMSIGGRTKVAVLR